MVSNFFDSDAEISFWIECDRREQVGFVFDRIAKERLFALEGFAPLTAYSRGEGGKRNLANRWERDSSFMQTGFTDTSGGDRK